MRLFAEQGYETTTVAQIAAAAEVSTRSVSAYFPTKLDIAAASSNDAADRLRLALDSNTQPLADVFMQWLEKEATLVDEEEWELRAQMMRANPALTSSGTVHTQAMATAVLRAIAADLGVAEDAPAAQLGFGVLSGLALQCQLLPGDLRADPDVLETVRAASAGAIDGIRTAMTQGTRQR